MPAILIVDDDSDVRRALRRVLEREGMAVTEAASGPDALETLGREPVHAVVIDVLMPEMNGLEFYDELVIRVPDLRGRAIFLTGAAGEPDVHTRIEQRGAPLLSKLDDLSLVGDALRLALLRRPTEG